MNTTIKTTDIKSTERKMKLIKELVTKNVKNSTICCEPVVIK